ncbi:MAG TPA: hypothetical protein VGE36_00625 [Roseateles sp.]
MKRMALACVLISTALLSGCIIVPGRGGHHHHHGYSGGHYQGQVYGPAYGQPGRR